MVVQEVVICEHCARGECLLRSAGALRKVCVPLCTVHDERFPPPLVVMSTSSEDLELRERVLMVA